MKNARPAALAVAVNVILCGFAYAQSNPASHQPPDWTTELRGKNLGDLKQVNPNLSDVITAHLQPWARAKMAATDGVADDTGAVCEPDGIFRYPVNAQGPGTFLWLPATDKIVLILSSASGGCSTGNNWNIR